MEIKGLAENGSDRGAFTLMKYTLHFSFLRIDGAVCCCPIPTSCSMARGSVAVFLLLLRLLKFSLLQTSALQRVCLEPKRCCT